MSNENIISFGVDDNKKFYNFKNDNYQKLKTLGEGSFGKVVLLEKVGSTNQVGSNYFAIKISKRFKKGKKNIEQDGQKNEEKPKEINFIELRELVIMKKLKHQNTMDLKDYKFCREEREIWILMDYFPIDLGKFFSQNKNNTKVMNEKFFKNIAHQILSGINYLHQNMIIHRDLKLENILYDEKKNIAKITDFGLSRQLDYDISTQYTNVGTFPYKPPELLLGLTHYSTSFDIWSAGCILVEICIGEHLFGENDSLGVIKLMYHILGPINENVLPGFKKFPSSKILDDESLQKIKVIGLIDYIKSKQLFDFKNDEFYDLIKKMLCIDPTKRISAKECLNHPWLSNMDI
jgi:serine/threonine protein kinase